MSQKQIKIIPLKLLDNKLFKFLILSFKISIDNVIHFCSLGGVTICFIFVGWFSIV